MWNEAYFTTWLFSIYEPEMAEEGLRKNYRLFFLYVFPVLRAELTRDYEQEDISALLIIKPRERTMAWSSSELSLSSWVNMFLKYMQDLVILVRVKLIYVIWKEQKYVHIQNEIASLGLVSIGSVGQTKQAVYCNTIKNSPSGCLLVSLCSYVQGVFLKTEFV